LGDETCPQCGTRLNFGALHREGARPAVSRRVVFGEHAPHDARRALDPLGADLSCDALDRLQLLVSELVTNAVRHAGLTAGDEIALNVFVDPETLYVEVHDDGVGYTPDLPNPDPLRASGWGLWLLEALTDRWGIYNGGGTTAWFEMQHREAPSAG
jgi:anti-sigma regulatory factor (Ser/Thr protein kinase)